MVATRLRDRVCAGCGFYKRIYFQYKDPNRSLCCVCYANPELHHKYGKGYRGPRLDPPHPQVHVVASENLEAEQRARKPQGTEYTTDLKFGQDPWADYSQKWRGEAGERLAQTASQVVPKERKI